MFELDGDRCAQIGKDVSELKLKEKAFFRLAPILSEENLTGLILTYVSGICHQTQNLVITIGEKKITGWDCLMQGFVNTAKSYPEKLLPQNMSRIKPLELALFLGQNKVINQSALLPDFKLEQRAEFLRDISIRLMEDYESSTKNLFEEARYRLESSNGIYAQLENFSAFKQDPIRKKSTLLTRLMVKAGLSPEVRDPENLIPMIDYHKERLFLRTGCVVVKDEDITKALKNRKTVGREVDDALRTISVGAYQKILSASNIDFFELEVKLWGFARAYCHKPEQTLCLDGKKSNSEYVDFSTSTCPLEKNCAKLTDYWQPQAETTFH